jgi:hypothetical protein
VTLDDTLALERLAQRALEGSIDPETFTLADDGRKLLRAAKVSADHRRDAERIAGALGLKLEEL